MMKLKTSFFNATVLKKDITRFAPVWGIYSVILLLNYLIGCMRNVGDPEYMLRDLDGYFASFGIVNLFYAWICAMAVFGDLYKSRVCNALHAMPIRREGWFLSHVVAALLFCAVPNTVMAIFIAPILGQYWYLSFLWLVVSLMQFITMFGMAAFMAMCSGTRLGMFIAYAAANLWPFLVKGFLNLFYSEWLYGVPLEMIQVNELWPVSHFLSMDYIIVKTVYEGRLIWSHFQGVIGRDILITALWTLVGIALLGGALLLYRRRKLETAGDFMANRPAAVVFHILFCMFAGWVFCGIGSGLPKVTAIIIGFLGITVGFFAGQMLLQRKVNVFSRKGFGIWGLVMAFMAVSVILTAADPLGITTKIPEKDQIKSVVVYDGSNGYYFPDPLISVEKPQDTEAVLRMHKKLIENRPETSDYREITFVYELTDGSTFKRTYPITQDSLDQSALTKIYSNWENLFDTSDWEKYTGSVTGIYIYPRDSDETSLIIVEDLSKHVFPENCRKVPMDENSREKVLALMQTMKEECSTRPMIPDSYDFYWFQSDYLVIIQTQEDGETVNRDILVSRGCVKTNAMIEELMEAYYVY